jgi:hypothetical protein
MLVTDLFTESRRQHTDLVKLKELVDGVEVVQGLLGLSAVRAVRL